ncbi:hypothetical protein KUTeg_005598 [Tegillarca granosa]|uniref:Macro domain-containing protein n=1 Tax=Tegillarca granosa TaxID=220873 RepID=A0ABQ9FK76_TEGGR|nr:hypothetical protein KUTeg_005598 [Tegillarca granosa]
MTVEKGGETCFKFNGNLKVWIYSGNLLQLETKIDVIVSTGNCTVSGKGGLAMALLHNAGNKYVQAHGAILSGNGRLQEGSVSITHAGKLKFRNIYHVVTEQFQCDTLPKHYELEKQKTAVKKYAGKSKFSTLEYIRQDKDTKERRDCIYWNRT